ncbi:uncharacterized protein LOC135848074 [Planococcus citri]|uniref:uncharacterized protein LOC135848074 n=1 Tax=Planococcus citri TaxID=170843 RepID=UPI0031F93C6C
MKYDFSKWHVERLTYFITQNDSDLQIECKNKNLGMQFYAKDNLYTYYLDGNQKTVFKDVTVPKIRSVYVSPHALLAPYQFQTIPSEEISCSSLVEVPIWYETAEEPLNYSEKFLVAASQVTSQRLKIIVGTYETLTLQTEKGNKPHEMFLNGKKIPIPKIIYKIVKFKSHNRGVGKRTYWFNAVIVIHNQPQVNKEDIICEDKSKYWGWESLRYMSTTNRDENTKSDFIYVCELDKDMQTKLGYYTSNELNLELDYFPSYNKKNARIEFENWQEKFETRMRDLFETTPEPVVDSNRSETQKEI